MGELGSLFKKNGLESIKWTSSGILTGLVVVIFSGGKIIDSYNHINILLIMIAYIVAWFGITCIFVISDIEFFKRKKKNNSKKNKTIKINIFKKNESLMIILTLLIVIFTAANLWIYYKDNEIYQKEYELHLI